MGWLPEGSSKATEPPFSSRSSVVLCFKHCGMLFLENGFGASSLKLHRDRQIAYKLMIFRATLSLQVAMLREMLFIPKWITFIIRWICRCFHSWHLLLLIRKFNSGFRVWCVRFWLDTKSHRGLGYRETLFSRLLFSRRWMSQSWVFISSLLLPKLSNSSRRGREGAQKSLSVLAAPAGDLV